MITLTSSGGLLPMEIASIFMMGPFVSRSDNGFHVSVQEKRKFNKTRRIVIVAMQLSVIG
jgi:hypothetical protein